MGARERRPLSPFCCSSNSYPSNTCISSTPVAHHGNEIPPVSPFLSSSLRPSLRHPLLDCERFSRTTRERLAHRGVDVEEGRKATSTSGSGRKENIINCDHGRRNNRIMGESEDYTVYGEGDGAKRPFLYLPFFDSRILYSRAFQLQHGPPSPNDRRRFLC